MRLLAPVVFGYDILNRHHLKAKDLLLTAFSSRCVHVKLKVIWAEKFVLVSGIKQSGAFRLLSLLDNYLFQFLMVFSDHEVVQV